MQQSHGSAFPTKDINIGHIHYHTTRRKLYLYKGGGPASTETNWIELSNSGTYRKPYVLSGDPDTSTWGTSEQGYSWYNSTDQQLKMWDGTAIVIVG